MGVAHLDYSPGALSIFLCCLYSLIPVELNAFTKWGSGDGDKCVLVYRTRVLDVLKLASFYEMLRLYQQNFLRGKLGFYYKEHEILPPLPVGFHRYLVDSASSDEDARHQTDEFDPPSEVRAIIEGQFLSMRGHAERCGLPVPPKRIIATGGASSNQAILKIMASIFGCPVYTVQRPDSASLGAALRAAHGWLCKQQGEFVPVSRVYSGRLETTSLSMKLAVPFGDCEGDAELLNKYTSLAKKRLAIEQKLVERFGRRR